MDKKSRKLVVTSIIFIFLVSAINIKNISNENKSSDEIEIEKSLNNEELIEEPEKSKVRFLGTILAPVTNLVQSALGNDCDPFYEGSVPHPEKK